MRVETRLDTNSRLKRGFCCCSLSNPTMRLTLLAARFSCIYTVTQSYGTRSRLSTLLHHMGFIQITAQQQHTVIIFRPKNYLPIV